jgi:hypothetical protein
MAHFQLLRLLLSFSPAHQSWWAVIRIKNMINIIGEIILLAVFLWAIKVIISFVVIIGSCLFPPIAQFYKFIKNKLK